MKGELFLIKSLCFKTNNENAINYLLNQFNSCKLKDFYFSKRKFKNYNNLIVHYKGSSTDSFFSLLALSLSGCICDIFENDIIKNIISCNYFYLTDVEQEIVFNNCINYIHECPLDEAIAKKDALYISFFEYMIENKKMNIDGFINFRIKDYIKILDSIVDLSVNKFVIDREYNNFINLVKSYIDSKPCLYNKIHLIYNNDNSLLLDESLNIIETNYNQFNSKYLSDISFSSNDYSLNALLCLLPKNIIIHSSSEDEFINTLKLIFTNRITICKKCEICDLLNSKPINSDI